MKRRDLIVCHVTQHENEIQRRGILEARLGEHAVDLTSVMGLVVEQGEKNVARRGGVFFPA